MRPKRITYEVRDEAPAPGEGDVLDSSRSCYLVIKSRAINTRDGARRFALDVVRIGDAGKKHDGNRYTLSWDKRSRRHG